MKLIYLLFACLTLFLTSCEEDEFPPKACLEVDNNYPKEREFIKFDNCSEDAYRIEINFGDGTFAKYAPVNHSYKEAGNYVATLTAWSLHSNFKSESLQKIVVGLDTGTTDTTIITDTIITPPDTVTIIDTVAQNILPTACFTPGTLTAESGAEILFINCSLNASSFSWNFGDGSTSTAQNPRHTFAASGTYPVMLTAYNASGQADTTVMVTIGERVLVKVILKNFDPLKPDGTTAWDDLGIPIPGLPVEPDIYISLNSASGATLETTIKGDAMTSALPLSWNVASENLTLTDENWTLTIYDDESFFGAPELMFEWDNINLGTQGANGLIQLSSGRFSVDLEYTVQ